MAKNINLRLPDTLAQQVTARAVEVGRSRNDWIATALAYVLAESGATLKETTTWQL